MKKLITLLFVMSLGANAIFIFTSLKVEKKSYGNTVATDIANLQKDFPSPAQCTANDATLTDADRDAAIAGMKTELRMDPTDARHYAIISPALMLQMILQTPMNDKSVIVVYPTLSSRPATGHEALGVVCRGGTLNADNSITFDRGALNYLPTWCPDLCPAH